MKWSLKSSRVPKDIAELEAVLLATHAIEDSNNFFQIRNPLDIPASELGIKVSLIKTIIKRLREAREKNEEIVIFGDYDADGITATAILWETLHELGFRAWPFIPQRLKHGYGLSIRALDEVFKEHPHTSLLITVDNGIVAHEALTVLAKRKISVIVTDHHQPDQKKPEAFAVFHTTQVCGAAVAWFLAKEILTAFAYPQKEVFLKSTLELLAISTVTDLMPLIGINRDILIAALEQLRQSKRPGLHALFQLAQLDPHSLDSYKMGFVIGPRINAMGRLADATDALRLLCTKDSQKAKLLAQALQDTNSERQNLTQDLVSQAEAQAESQRSQKILLVAGEMYHEGVIGLLAGKLLEKYHKPTIVFSQSEQLVKASARSLPGFNITEFIRGFSALLLEFGGHPLAAGFALLPQNLQKLQVAMWQTAAEVLADAKLEPELAIDCQLPASLIDLAALAVIERFEPFGLANPQPKFLLKDCQVKLLKPLGKTAEHWQILLTTATQEPLHILAFSRPDLLGQLQTADQMDFVVTLSKNVWQQKVRLQVILKDFRRSV